MTKNVYYYRLLILLLLLIALSFLSIMIGSYGFILPENAILSYRLNRTILAIVAGSSLAASGASLQALFRNPLADPHLFGISGGCATGACLAIAISNAQTLVLPSIGAIAGGFLAFLLIYFYIKDTQVNLNYN